MKNLLFTLLFSSLFITAFAQPAQRSIRFKFIARDSLALPLDAQYHLIEDSCSSIIRHVRFDPAKRIFKGPFSDISRHNPDLILSKGFFTEDGKLDGSFEEYYPDGKLKAKGIFKQGSMVGTWTIFKEDGNTWMEFEEANGTKKILNVWDEKGKQTIKDGNGTYSQQAGEIVWTGKLVNGIPDGTWRSTNTSKPGQTSLSQETFNKGNFVKGLVSGITYQDQSRINLEPRAYLHALNAESLRISQQNCDGEQMINNYQHAYFRNGSNQLLEILKEKIGPAIGKFDYSVLNMRKFRIYGIIDEKGTVSDLRYIEYLNYAHANELINAINTLPSFVPAKENGRNVKSNIIFEFNTTSGGWYNYHYKFTRFQDFKSVK